MTLRTFAVLLAAWTWILAPGLCTAGVLAHGCLCEDQIACAHESDCVTDPCRELAVREPGGARDIVDIVVADWAQWPGERSAATPTLVRSPSLRSSRRPPIPFPPSDRPLRI